LGDSLISFIKPRSDSVLVDARRSLGEYPVVPVFKKCESLLTTLLPGYDPPPG
jgi:hypothetical protein